MQIALHILYEVSVDLVFSVHHLVFLHLRFSALTHQCHVLFTFEQTRNFSGRKQGVHFFQESWSKNVALIEDKANFFLFDTSSFHDISEIVVKVNYAVFSTCFDLIH